jgi:hypothetical protein
MTRIKDIAGEKGICTLVFKGFSCASVGACVVIQDARPVALISNVDGTVNAQR